VSQSVIPLPNHAKCLVHFLSLTNPDHVVDYLKTAWLAEGGIGATQFYAVILGNAESLAVMKFQQIYDFQRIILLLVDKVCDFKYI
jgi:hypothetical protein